MWDGMSINNNIGLGGGSSKQFFLNQAAVEEMVISTSDMNAEYPFGGVATNAIPKEGANTFSYYVNVSGTNGGLQQNNVDAGLEPRLAQPGFATQGTRKEKIGVDKIWDYGFGLGGPLVRDRVWFYTAHRWWGAQNEQYRSFANVAEGYASNPGATGYGALYRADLTDPSVLDIWNRDNSIRFTIQASERNKFTLSQAFQDNCACTYWTQWGLSDPAAAINYTYGPINLTQASWTMPANNRLLFEAGVSLLKNNTAPEFPDVVRQDSHALAATGMTMAEFMAVDPGTALQHVDVGHHSYTPFFNWRSYASAIPGREDCGPCLGGTGHDMPTRCSARRCRTSPVRTTSRWASTAAGPPSSTRSRGWRATRGRSGCCSSASTRLRACPLPWVVAWSATSRSSPPRRRRSRNRSTSGSTRRTSGPSIG